MTQVLDGEQLKNYEFFCSHLKEYLSDPVLYGKYAIIFSERLQGAYDSAGAAYTEARSRFPRGEFIIQQVIDPTKLVEYLSSAV